jgi:Na+-translocating ferredoxin:NAD+ oxidoreductase RNF subunit RnfB
MTAQAQSRKPHEMAFLPDTPCAQCGYEWARPILRFTEDGNAEFADACANMGCQARRSEWRSEL